ncbi:hypothetical protein B0T22DRAFT_520592 [Podospora appendiculata]|uniref:Fungal N-terminal domain-containing protein n=1 Tax=Podospora appendiculata TaxID=314037 RepID=A0AAE1C9H6_9PEZI|nr:hypothetical protein B0T22DRAFT_520592 [Podospora appendiculata]
MSGVQSIVGTVLGGLPMVVGAFEEYRKLSMTLDKIQVRLDAQQFIFEDGVRRLQLAIEKSRESIESWVSSQSEAVSGGLIDLIRKNSNHCKKLLDQIAELIHQMLLFRFGIVLLETGLSRPLQGLMGLGGSHASSPPPSEQSNYHVAEQLCQELKDMRKYQRIVRDCIKRGGDQSCNGPSRTGLDSQDLRILADAVIDLKSAEKGLMKILNGI